MDKRLKLTMKQKEIFENLVNAVKKAEDAEIGFVAYDNGDIFAVNTSKVDKICSLNNIFDEPDKNSETENCDEDLLENFFSLSGINLAEGESFGVNFKH